MIAEREYPYTLTAAETELVEILRMAHMAAFSFSTAHRDGVFTIKLTNIEAAQFLEGKGTTFDDAWRSLFGSKLHGMATDLRERMATHGLRVVNRLTVLDGGLA